MQNKKNVSVLQWPRSPDKAMRGFTMIELMVVIVILGILAAAIVPNLIGRDDVAKVTVAKSDIRNISNALSIYKLDNGNFPNTEEGLDALVQAPESARNWAPGGYLPKMPLDPWGNPYVYISPGVAGPYDLLSLGADGAEGGEEFNADISLGDL